MYLMYIDESGDCGLHGSPTRYFVLTGLVVHELRWQQYYDQLIDFRRRMKTKFGLKMREELHVSAMLHRPGDLVRIKRNDRLTIIRSFADEVANMTDISLINIVVDKASKAPDYDVFGMAWKTLIQRFENTLSRRNFPGPANADERGMLFPDHTDTKKLTTLLRQMRRYNPIPHQAGIQQQGHRNLVITKILEDPNFRDSAHSLFIQATDLAAFLLYQNLAPNTYMKKKSGQNYFNRIESILCRQASSSNARGIVRL